MLRPYNISRRTAFLGGLLVSYLTLMRSRLANSDDFDFNVWPPVRTTPFGTLPPRNDEEIIAKELVDGAPTAGSPVKVMEYFLALKDANKDGERYNEAWKTRWNPIIVEFFLATGTTPSGDTTSWCAASLNWCLMRVGLPTTGSAASSSFRAWTKARQTDSPKYGDIVVFQAVTPSEQYKGHVGFFVEQTDENVLVLGGNQFNQARHHQISRKLLSKNGSILKLHSYRSLPEGS